MEELRQTNNASPASAILGETLSATRFHHLQLPEETSEEYGDNLLVDFPPVNDVRSDDTQVDSAEDGQPLNSIHPTPVRDGSEACGNQGSCTIASLFNCDLTPTSAQNSSSAEQINGRKSSSSLSVISQDVPGIVESLMMREEGTEEADEAGIIKEMPEAQGIANPPFQVHGLLEKDGKMPIKIASDIRLSQLLDSHLKAGPAVNTLNPAGGESHQVSRQDGGPSSGKKSDRRKPRTYSQAVPSQHCHICSRRPTASSPHVVCGNLQQGRCRKTVCTKCFHQFRWDLRAARSAPLGGWECPHCRGICPQRAQCVIYNRTSDRRRMNMINHRKRKSDEVTGKAANVREGKRRSVETCGNSPGSGSTSAAGAVLGTAPTVGSISNSMVKRVGLERLNQNLPNQSVRKGEAVCYGTVTAEAEGVWKHNLEQHTDADGAEADDLQIKEDSEAVMFGAKFVKHDRQDASSVEFDNAELLLHSDVLPLVTEADASANDAVCLINTESKVEIVVDASTGVLMSAVSEEGKTGEEVERSRSMDLEYFLEDFGDGAGSPVHACPEITESADDDWVGEPNLNEFHLDAAIVDAEAIAFETLL